RKSGGGGRGRRGGGGGPPGLVRGSRGCVVRGLVRTGSGTRDVVALPRVAARLCGVSAGCRASRRGRTAARCPRSGRTALQAARVERGGDRSLVRHGGNAPRRRPRGRGSQEGARRAP